MTIISTKSSGLRQDDTFYLVRFSCCGDDKVLSHRGIIGRMNNAATKCTVCAKKAHPATYYAKNAHRKITVSTDPAPPVEVLVGVTRGLWPSLTPYGPRPEASRETAY